MVIFKGHKLEENENGKTLILYLNSNSVEFAKDLGDDTEKTVSIREAIDEYVENNFKNVKINAIKLILGTVLVSTIILGSNSVFAADTNTTAETAAPTKYVVQSGDTLWLISQKTGVSITNLKLFNNLPSDTIYVGQALLLQKQETQPPATTQNEYYTVVSGDTLWIISTKVGVSIDTIRKLNNLTSDMIYPGQKLIVKQTTAQPPAQNTYTVKSGDTLWLIAKNNNTTIDAIRNANNLTSDMLMIGQVLVIPAPAPTPPPVVQPPQPVYNWPDTTYIVQPGDTVSGVAKKLNTTTDNILKYNYMTPDEWLNAGDKIAISDYAPRTYTVTPGEALAPAQVGTIVDWFTEGQYLLKRGYEFTVVDVDTGKQFKARMIGGYNHADIEPLAAADTAVMKDMFATWQWNPRAVVIFINGTNIAASLSGMPHDVDTIGNNDVTGHFDLYLLNSTSHGTASSAYIDLHQAMVLKAGGR